MATTGTSNVLIIDDDPDILDVIADMLPTEVIAIKVSNEIEAFKILNGQSIDLVICDIHIGKADGLGFLERCHRQQIWVPFIMISGFADKQKILKAMRLGAIDVVEKPTIIEYFRGNFQRHLASCKSVKKVNDSLKNICEIIDVKPTEDVEFLQEYLTLLELQKNRKRAV